MKHILNVILFIINPFRTFGFGKTSDKISSHVNKRDYISYLVAFLITLAVILFKYFI